jgi:hypothetical protein
MNWFGSGLLCWPYDAFGEISADEVSAFMQDQSNDFVFNSL